ncbi:MAG TPA: hypothetical protein VF701_02485 [Thermoanaerobaculia bacterium]
MNRLLWALTAAASAYASMLAVHHSTPIDRSLPHIAVILILLAAMSHWAVTLAVPALIVCEIAIPEESSRLLAFGAVLAVALVTALLAPEGSGDRRRSTTQAAPFVALAAVLLLRWIPVEDVQVVREVALLVLALAIVLVMGRTPLSVLVAVTTALFTPGLPLRTIGIPLAVLAVAWLGRRVGLSRLSLAWPSGVALGSMILFFAWSGVFARATPYFVRNAAPAESRYTVNHALAAGESSTLPVPDDARSLIVSGANVARMRRGAILGRIDPGGIEVRIGDAADWGYMRREEFRTAKNPLPRDPAGRIHGYGYGAWLDGAGRIALPPGSREIRVTADDGLPAGASIQVEAFELAK